MDDLPPLEAAPVHHNIMNNKNTTPCIVHSDDDDEDADDVEMEPFEEEPTTCLFCTHVSRNVDVAISHVAEAHNVNFSELKSRFQLDQYGFLKLINCIRSENINADKIATTKEMFWQDEKYLKPISYEPWLSYDYDEMPATKVVNSEKATQLQIEVQRLQEQVKQQSLLLEQAADDMRTMRASFQRLLEQEGKTTPEQAQCVANKSVKSDESYFSSYAHFGIHHEMLSDVVRTTSYRDALLLNKAYVQGKDVLDVGCGTSVLSIFASQAGAATVVGIDNSDIIYNAMDIVKRNNVDRVTLVKGRLEHTELPQQKYDMIISEWMGYFLLFEGMLDTVIYARDHHLKEGGVLLPNRCTMSIVGYGSDKLYEQRINYWDDVYGLNMSNMRADVLHEPLIDIVDVEHVLTDANMVADLNLAKVDLNYSNFQYDFNLKCHKVGKLSAIVGYFDTFFDLPTPVMFSTGPSATPTHWKQVVFFLEQPHAVQVNDVITGTLICKRSRSDARSLDITIKVFDKECTYYLD